jgi:hypothetical protein
MQPLKLYRSRRSLNAISKAVPATLLPNGTWESGTSSLSDLENAIFGEVD